MSLKLLVWSLEFSPPLFPNPSSERHQNITCKCPDSKMNSEPFIVLFLPIPWFPLLLSVPFPPPPGPDPPLQQPPAAPPVNSVPCWPGSQRHPRVQRDPCHHCAAILSVSSWLLSRCSVVISKSRPTAGVPSHVPSTMAIPAGLL